MSIEAKHAYRFTYLKSDQWKAVRLEALVREKGKCQICGDESAFNDAHHVWYPENICDTKEYHLVILCRACHEFLHAMLPECKTNDEEAGRVQWIKFRNAIEHWRVAKLSLFEHPEGFSKMRQLGAAYDALRKKFEAQRAILQRYESRLGKLGFSPADQELSVADQISALLFGIKRLAADYAKQEITKVVTQSDSGDAQTVG